jgi:hypothetical protein
VESGSYSSEPSASLMCHGDFERVADGDESLLADLHLQRVWSLSCPVKRQEILGVFAVECRTVEASK